MKAIALFACLIVLFSVINLVEGKKRRKIIIITKAQRDAVLRELDGLSNEEKRDLLRDLHENLEDEEDRRRSLSDEEQAFDWEQ